MRHERATRTHVSALGLLSPYHVSDGSLTAPAPEGDFCLDGRRDGPPNGLMKGRWASPAFKAVRS